MAGIALFDCEYQGAEPKLLRNVPGATQMHQSAMGLIAKLKPQCEKPGPNGTLTHILCVALRTNPKEIRYFNLDDGSAHIYGKALLGPEWRIALPEEVAASEKEADATRLKAAQSRVIMNSEAAAALASRASFVADVNLVRANQELKALQTKVPEVIPTPGTEDETKPKKRRGRPAKAAAEETPDQQEAAQPTA